MILIVGDLHIPQRCLKIPKQFAEILTPGKVHKILCTGNLTTNEQVAYLQSLCKDVYIVNGDQDEKIHDAKESLTVKIGAFSFGLIHGHQILPVGDPERLASFGMQSDVDVVVSGHTHKASISTYEGRLLLNPGSLTGAYSISGAQSTPSFILLDVKKDQMTCYLYQLNESDEVEVFEYRHNKF